MNRFSAGILQAEVMRVGLLHALTPPGDATYSAPKSSWLLGEYAAWLEKALAALGCATYTPESGDCDDFADLYAVLARIAHRRTPGSAGSALAVGTLFYTQDKGGGHAINVVYTSDLGLIFVEPQTCKRVTLSATELKSAIRLCF